MPCPILLDHFDISIKSGLIHEDWQNHIASAYFIFDQIRSLMASDNFVVTIIMIRFQNYFAFLLVDDFVNDEV